MRTARLGGALRMTLDLRLTRFPARFVLLAWLWLGSLGPAAFGQAAERIDLRVVNAAPGGLVEVDRGSADGLELGDPVVLMPRSGRVVEGLVTVVEERTALVEIDNPNVELPAGTRGQAVVPASRFAPAAPSPNPVSPKTVASDAPGEDQASATEPEPADPLAGLEQRWKNLDEAYSPGMPLLSDAGVARPEQRPMRFTGRLYLPWITSCPARTAGMMRSGGWGKTFPWRTPLGSEASCSWTAS